MPDFTVTLTDEQADDLRVAVAARKAGPMMALAADADPATDAEVVAFLEDEATGAVRSYYQRAAERERNDETKATLIARGWEKPEPKPAPEPVPEPVEIKK